MLWLDGVERKYVEEVGSMNVLLQNRRRHPHRALRWVTVLPGITRMSCIELLEKWGYNGGL